MKKLCLLLGLLCVCSWGQTDAIQGHTFVGGTPAATSGMKSANYLHGIIPGASVTVYLTGTQIKATIYADGSNTPLSNPFFSNAAAATDPGGFLFYALDNQGYDIQAQGGQQNASCTTAPLCYTQATMLLVDVKVGTGGTGSGTVQASPQFLLPYFDQTGTQAHVKGDSGITTDGSGNLTAKGISTTTGFKLNNLVHASDFGVVGDEIDNHDGSMTAASATLTATSSPFTSSMAGHPIDVYGAGTSVTPTLTLTAGSLSATVSNGSGITYGMLVTATGVPASTYVANISGTTVTLTQPATATASGEASTFASPLSTTISTYTDANHVTLAASAVTSVANVEYVTGTDNSTALASLQSYLQAHDGTRLVFAKGSGCYDYTVNTWLQGIKNADIDSNGACFRNLAYSAQDVNMYGLAVGQGFMPATSTPLYDINTQAAASQSVTTTTPGNAANFHVGDQVFIAGYSQQQASGPPNMRYFEVNTVASVNTSTGQINLMNPTQYYYDSLWYPDVENGLNVGPPFIYDLTTNGTVTQSMTLSNAVFKVDPNFNPESATAPQTGYGSLLVQGFIHFYLRHCTIGYLTMGSGDHAIVENSIIGTFEPDKLLNTLLVKDSTLNLIAEATGVNVLTIQGSTILSSSPVSPRQLYVTGNTLHTIPSNDTYFTVGTGGTVPTPTYTAFFAGNSFVPVSGMSESSNAIFAGTSYTMAAASNATSTTFRIPFDWNVETQLDSGSVLTTSGGKTCTTSIPPEYSSPNLLITVRNCSSSPANGDQFSFSNVHKATCLNNSFSSAPIGTPCVIVADESLVENHILTDSDAFKTINNLLMVTANGSGATDTGNTSTIPISPNGLRVHNGARVFNENAGGELDFNSDGTVKFIEANGHPIRWWGGTFTYSTLPSACSSTYEGAAYSITDSPSNVPGSVVASGGGQYHAYIYCDGAEWVIASVYSSISKTSITGTSAGTAVWWNQPGPTGGRVDVFIYLNGYENTTATAQTFTIPTGISTVSYTVTDGGTCTGITASGTTVTLPSSMGATQTGLCEIRGY